MEYLLDLLTHIFLLFVAVHGEESVDTLGDTCRDLVKREKWTEALKTCNEALSDRKSLEDGELYHVIIARARAIIHEDDPRGSLKDLDEAIQMKPALTGPYWIRAEANLKLGDFLSARKDLERFDESSRLNDLRRQIDRAEMEMRLAREAQKQSNWRGVAERCNSVLKNYSPHLGEARVLLKDAILKLKDYPRGLKMAREAKLTDDKLLMGKLYFATGDFKGALRELKDLKGNEKEVEFMQNVSSKFDEIDGMLLRPSIVALESLSKYLESENNFGDLSGSVRLQVSALLCFKYAKVKNSEKAIEQCKSVMRSDPRGALEYSLSLAEAYGQLSQHDEAVGVLEEVARKNPRETRVQEALKAAQKARHEAANPDYYTILGVPRDASEKQIKLAYRRLAQKYHPDKLKSATPDQKRAAELKMGQINRAHDVLGDKEKRSQFDRGFDPENPQGNPFGHGGGGGGFGGGFNGGFGGGGFGGDGGGGVPFEFIFEAMRQQQQQQGRQRGGRAHHQQHQQFHFNFKDDL